MSKLLLFALIAAGCAHTAPTNYAAAVVQVADKDAQCMGILHAVGPDLADSALCGTHGSLVFVSVSAKDMNMKTLIQAAPPAQPAPPSPSGTPRTTTSTTTESHMVGEGAGSKAADPPKDKTP